jgi:hypothetical protein
MSASPDKPHYPWQPMTEGDRRAQARGRRVGCCGDDSHRGHLCTYHQGWSDGWDECTYIALDDVVITPDA